MLIHNNINYYLFLNNLNEINFKNINIFKNLSIIYQFNSSNYDNITNIITIKNFCRKKKISFFLINNFKIAIKYNADGVFLSSSYKKIVNFHLKKKNFKIIGSVHNQFEFYLKKKQLCNMIMLSPLFYNKKYSVNKVLNICKFKLKSINWGNNICALGGINLQTIKKTRNLKIKGLGFTSNFFYKKKPTCI